MTTLSDTDDFTPGPWTADGQFLVAPDPTGRFTDVYLAEIAEADEDGRLPPADQIAANARLMAAAPDLFHALRRAVAALNRVPAFRTDEDISSYALLPQLEAVLRHAVGGTPPTQPAGHFPDPVAGSGSTSRNPSSGD